MIERKTVLILGAGASEPYEFPTGSTLLEDMCGNLEADSLSGPKRILHYAGYGDDLVFDFSRALRRSGKLSVDTFLENRPEYMEVGKAAIASFLLPQEMKSKEENLLFRIPKNWYKYFFKQLGDTFEDFDKNSVSVLTFNYERSLEHFLLTALEHSYRKSPEKCAAQLLRSIPIIHLYGSLGNLPYLGDDALEYGADTNPKNLRQAAGGIKIINERDTGMEGFEQAQGLLKEAKAICFLGFGFDKTNLERLGLLPLSNSKKIYGSVLGLSELERKKVESMLGSSIGINLGKDDEDSLAILRNYPVFQ